MAAESDDEAKLMTVQADALLAGLETYVPEWAVRTIMSFNTGDGSSIEALEAAETVREAAQQTVLPAVGALLGTDIDKQGSSPLQVVRGLVPTITSALEGLGVPPGPRDANAVRLNPEDLYNISPANFAEIDPALHDLGLAWGAAKAHIHLKRHQSAGQEPEDTAAEYTPVVVVCAPELGDRSRFDAYDVTHVRSSEKLRQFASTTEPDLIIVDLDRTSDSAAFRLPNAHVIGFGSHVDTDRHDAALDAGFDAVLARSVFFRRLPELLGPVQKPTP